VKMITTNAFTGRTIAVLTISAFCLASACSREEPETPTPAETQPPVATVSGVQPVAPPATSTAELPFDEIKNQLLERMSVQPGERVLIVVAPGRFDPLVQALREGVVAAGAVDLGAVPVGSEPAPDVWSTEFTQSLTGLSGAELVSALSSVDLGIMMPGASPLDAPYAALQDVLRSGRGRTVHFHWRGGYALDGTELPVDAEIDALYVRALAETDYQQLADTEQRFEAAMRGGETRVTTPAGTDLRFRIGDRVVNRQDGDASAAGTADGTILIDREIELPAGAIRVAPMEDSVNGTLAFPPSVWAGVTVEGLVLKFESGRVTDIQATSGREAVVAELDAAGPAGRAFREFVLGFNPLLTVQKGKRPWIPNFGYGAGVVRLSLGDNSELGGAVGGGYVRWNLFTDATVTVGEEVWVKDGVLSQLPAPPP